MSTPWTEDEDFATAHQAARAERQRRTTEAQDQINAARANPTDVELEAQLQDDALHATPAVREMGGHGIPDLDLKTGRAVERATYTPIDPANLPPGLVLLAGPQAVAYRALEAAAKHALETQLAHQAAGAEIRNCIEALCRTMAPGKVG